MKFADLYDSTGKLKEEFFEKEPSESGERAYIDCRKLPEEIEDLNEYSYCKADSHLYSTSRNDLMPEKRPGIIFYVPDNPGPDFIYFIYFEGKREFEIVYLKQKFAEFKFCKEIYDSLDVGDQLMLEMEDHEWK